MYLRVPAAAAASRANEKEPGGPAQRTRRETSPVRGGEGQLGGPAEDSGTAETRRLQVNIASHMMISEGLQS